MDRAYASGAAGTPPAPPASPSIGYPQPANPGLGAPATKPGKYWYYMITEEIRNVIAAAGLTPDQADVTQLSDSILAMISANAPTSIGRHTIWVPAAAIYSRITAGAGYSTIETVTNKIVSSVLTFDPAAIEYAQFMVQMPKSWNEGTLTAVIVWSHPTGSGDVVWGIQGLARSDADPLDAAFGTAVLVTDSGGTADTVYKATETAAITLGGAPAENDIAVLQVYRDATNGADTLAVDARLHGIALFYTTTTGTDA